MILLAVSQVSVIASSDCITRMLSTDAHTEQDALLPQPSYGTVNVYVRSFPPPFTNLKVVGRRIYENYTVLRFIGDFRAL